MSDFVPDDQVMPSEAMQALREMAKSPGAVAVWRHQSCGRVAAVVVDTPDRWLFTYGQRRLMVGPNLEGATLGLPSGWATIAGTLIPLPPLARCCGAPFPLDWAELWADAEKGRQQGRFVKREVT